MKRIALFILCLLAVVGTTWADTPVFVNEADFPTFEKPLTPADQARLGLSAKILTETLDVLNRVGPSDYKFDRLEPGDVVLVDHDGTPRYKASCGNKIATLPIKVTTIVAPPPVAPIAGMSALTSSVSGMNWMDFFKTLGALLLTALLIAVALALIIWVLGAFRRERAEPDDREPRPAPAPQVIPLVSPAPVSPAPEVVIATPGSEEPLLIVLPTVVKTHRRPSIMLEIKVTVPQSKS